MGSQPATASHVCLFTKCSQSYIYIYMIIVEFSLVDRRLRSFLGHGHRHRSASVGNGVTRVHIYRWCDSTLIKLERSLSPPSDSNPDRMFLQIVHLHCRGTLPCERPMAIEPLFTITLSKALDLHVLADKPHAYECGDSQVRFLFQAP